MLTCSWVWLAAAWAVCYHQLPEVSLLGFLFLSLLKSFILHPSPAAAILDGYSSPGSDTALHYLVELPSQEGCVSDGCKAKESAIKISGELSSSQFLEKKSFWCSVVPHSWVLLSLWPCFVLMQAVVLFAA